MHTSHDHEAGGADIDEKDAATCPVMHITVSKKEAEAYGLARTYGGKQYYLCCDACTDSFDKDSEQYVNHEEKGTV